MFKFDNTHIFTGYLKQLLSSVNIPTCKIYTAEFANYLKKHGTEDPRVLESFDTLVYTGKNEKGEELKTKTRTATHFTYIKNNEFYNYFWNYKQNAPKLNHTNTSWKQASNAFYDKAKRAPGLTRALKSSGSSYDTTTHEYLGEYLRFLRDYYDVNLMSLYNCFNNKIYNNIYFKPTKVDIEKYPGLKNVVFDSQDSKYKIYAFPVKLFANYTIALDSPEIEMFCGFYKVSLETPIDLVAKTYTKIRRPLFNQPFIFNKLDVKYWNFDLESSSTVDGRLPLIDDETTTRYDIAKREQDLKLFIKVPTTCKSSIVVLEGDFRHFNDFKYLPVLEPTLTMDSCAVGAKVTVNGGTASALRGYAPRDKGNCIETFSNCYSLANIDGKVHYGLVGASGTSNNKITNCYNATGPLAYSYSPGLNYDVSNSYEAVKLEDQPKDGELEAKAQYTKNDTVYMSQTDMRGKTSLIKMSNLNTNNKYMIDSETDNWYPTLENFVGTSIATGAPHTMPSDVHVWEQDVTLKPEDADGDGWYEITCGEELAYIVLNGSERDENGDYKKYRLTSDIYLNDINKINWTSGEKTRSNLKYDIRTWYQFVENSSTIKPFQGVLDGDGHIIYGLYFKENVDNFVVQQKYSTGLIPVISGAGCSTIKNLGIDYAYIQSKSNASAFVGEIVYDYAQANLRNVWNYQQNYSVVNFDNEKDLNESGFLPKNKLQLLVFNTGESYPFADRLVEYLSGSAITSLDPIPDNIKRAQRVMGQNNHLFKIEGLWENKIQKITYDYITNAGPVETIAISTQRSDTANFGKVINPKTYTGTFKYVLVDKRRGYHPRLGHTSKSTLYDVLGYIDRDAEKWYSSWMVDNSKAIVRDSIQNVDIYEGLFDI